MYRSKILRLPHNYLRPTHLFTDYNGKFM